MAANNEDAALASSFTDLMTSLAVIFILLLVAMMNNTYQEAENTKSQILSRLERALRIFQKQGVKVTRDPKDPLVLLVYVPEELLRFEQGLWEIPENGLEFLSEFSPKLASTACSSELRPGIRSIVVEGHASPEGKEKDNLRLSQQRSMEVLAKSLDVLHEFKNGENVSSDLHQCFLGLVSAVGRGSAEPITRDGKVNLQESRRVIFKIRVRSPDHIFFKKQISRTTIDKTKNGP